MPSVSLHTFLFCMLVLICTHSIFCVSYHRNKQGIAVLYIEEDVRHLSECNAISSADVILLVVQCNTTEQI